MGLKVVSSEEERKNPRRKFVTSAMENKIDEPDVPKPRGDSTDGSRTVQQPTRSNDDESQIERATAAQQRPLGHDSTVEKERAPELVTNKGKPVGTRPSFKDQVQERIHGGTARTLQVERGTVPPCDERPSEPSDVERQLMRRDAREADDVPDGTTMEHGSFGSDAVPPPRFPRWHPGAVVLSSIDEIPTGDIEAAAAPDSIAAEAGSQAEQREATENLPVAYRVTTTRQGPRRQEQATVLGIPDCKFYICCFIVLLIAIGAVLAGVCGAGYCGLDSSGEARTYRTTTPSGNESKFRAFTTTAELYQAVDIYILSLTEDPMDSIVSQMYGYPISTWDVSLIKDLSRVFDPERNSNFDLLRPPCDPDDDNICNTFNEDLSGWNVSAAETMFGMFAYATYFNQDLSAWDVSRVTDMSDMFASADAFNQGLSAWDTSSVTKMSDMFWSAVSFNQDLSTWNVSHVKHMWEMFNYAESFNQDLSAWDTGSVTTMRRMFDGATSFNQDLSRWNVGTVTNMQLMFADAASFCSSEEHVLNIRLPCHNISR
jgi:surface protein